MSNIPIESEHLLFEKLYTKGKTDKYRVLLKPYEPEIGVIKWQWKWRQYAFFTNPNVEADNIIFDLAILKEITKVLEALMGQRKEKK